LVQDKVLVSLTNEVGSATTHTNEPALAKTLANELWLYRGKPVMVFRLPNDKRPRVRFQDEIYWEQRPSPK